MDRRRLSEAWFKWHLIEMKIGLGERNIDTLVCSEVDAEIQRLLPRIHEHFTKKWSGSHHCDNCKSKDCSQALIIDGHMKGTRLVCDFMEGDICCEEIGSITVGCNQTPVKGSYFCVNHQHSLMKVNKIETQPDTDENQHSLQCKTEKRKQAANKHRSAGICCAVYNCGVVVGITELFGCESLSQVYVFLTWLWHAVQHFPRLFAYDDACHLKRYVNSR
ncbi:uncharacterized protein LOC134234383 [Saccostrea cucullata]|uniref:uncharacterized protein LOC134234383 n=1 Tax=Saccostrea cuccullata TaxID=36930 RepID=UPI002ECFF0EF